MLKSPLKPMEAKLVDAVPEGEGWQYEPKWDGFRCLIFRRGKEIELQSKSGRSLSRYFPELIDAIAKLKPDAFVLDGEIVIPTRQGIDFDQLLQRIHPAASRVQKLAKEFPAHFLAFDLLEDAGSALLTDALGARRKRLEQFAKKNFATGDSIHLSPATIELTQAREWLSRPGLFLDGLVAKRLEDPYLSGERAMKKFKRIRTADCVVGGFRYSAKAHEIGSLLLGLYDGGKLNHIGFCSGLIASERKALVRKLEPLIEAPGFTGKAPGGPSRWSTEKSSQWQPLKPVLVVEVSYDHVTNDRFRHGTRLIRWRPDKAPKQCTMDQVEAPQKSNALAGLIAGLD